MYLEIIYFLISFIIFSHSTCAKNDSQIKKDAKKPKNARLLSSKEPLSDDNDMVIEKKSKSPIKSSFKESLKKYTSLRPRELKSPGNPLKKENQKSKSSKVKEVQNKASHDVQPTSKIFRLSSNEVSCKTLDSKKSLKGSNKENKHFKYSESEKNKKSSKKVSIEQVEIKKTKSFNGNNNIKSPVKDKKKDTTLGDTTRTSVKELKTAVASTSERSNDKKFDSKKEKSIERSKSKKTSSPCNHKKQINNDKIKEDNEKLFALNSEFEKIKKFYFSKYNPQEEPISNKEKPKSSKKMKLDKSSKKQKKSQKPSKKGEKSLKKSSTPNSSEPKLIGKTKSSKSIKKTSTLNSSERKLIGNTKSSKSIKKSKSTKDSSKKETEKSDKELQEEVNRNKGIKGSIIKIKKKIFKNKDNKKEDNSSKN